MWKKWQKIQLRSEAERFARCAESATGKPHFILENAYLPGECYVSSEFAELEELFLDWKNNKKTEENPSNIKPYYFVYRTKDRSEVRVLCMHGAPSIEF